MEGCIHLYCGDGKGKTTASVGLSVRAAGAGKRVLFSQFSKDGSSSEIGVLRGIPGIAVEVCPVAHGFYRSMNEAQRLQAQADYSQLLERVLTQAREGVNLLVLDEIISTCNHGLVSEAVLLDFLDHRPEGLEVVLTGRDPSQELVRRADYLTEMQKRKHPYDQGVIARKGIEY